MSNFVPALQALRNAAPDQVIDVLHGTFLSVTRMDAHEVVAAYQTVRTVAEETGLMNDRMVQRLLKSLEVQMISLSSRVFGNQEIARFEAVLGRKFLGPDPLGLFRRP